VAFCLTFLFNRRNLHEKTTPMEKYSLKESILSSYQTLQPHDYNELVVLLDKLEKESSDATAMANRFNDYPEYKLLHEAYLRKKATETNYSASTIKIIVVVYFICSLLSGLYLFSKFVS
jgi:hypothetical protein